ncbi:carboxymuconolactone decarboxylase family protein [Caulobacter sp. NIBR2454]|uniref:carboxymuconolactone decarboxylase family protein n=1 Tax=Caulobacter sp. NIBR2454 TaxID=3015996 RepID=UPI0022B63014|nr:carboxymuconolactone decarboxylase family protein [Caulobacter sp. NIBR2454]
MTPRLPNPHKFAPEGVKAMIALETSIMNSGLEHPLIELVKLRASQINGCAFCLNMHATDARKHGEKQVRLDLLAAWREAPVYTARERAALAWTEALTLLPQNGASDADYAQVTAVFSEAEQVHLTLLIGAINTWNRLQVGFRVLPAVDPADVAA